MMTIADMGQAMGPYSWQTLKFKEPPPAPKTQFVIVEVQRVEQKTFYSILISKTD